MEGINIFDYDKIEIYSAVTFTNYTDELWGSTSIYSNDIKLSTPPDNYNSTLPVLIFTNTNCYRTTHYIFTDNNKIFLYSEAKAGWSTLKNTYKIKIVGYKY